MSDRRRYRKRADQFVEALALDLEIHTVTFTLAGREQRAGKGDWLVRQGDGLRVVAAADFDPADNERYEVAVPLNLDVCGFAYRKWGDVQAAKQGDWLVRNGEDVYTVDADTFASTYRRVAPDRYLKTTPVWAERADESGSIRTKEGRTHYEAGDYLVFNEPDGGDGYAVSAARFEAMYEVEA